MLNTAKIIYNLINNNLITTTILIGILQFLVLFLFSFVKSLNGKNIKKIFLTIICSWIFFFMIIYCSNHPKIIYFSSFLFILSSNLVIFTLWSLLNWGFTVQILLSTKKKYRSINSLINIFTRQGGLKYFCEDRLKLLLFFKIINKKSELIEINKKFKFVIWLILFFDKIFNIRKL
jgi:hypothetical protein